MVERVRSDHDPDDLAREFAPTARSIRHWVAVADRREGRREEKVEVVTLTERDELFLSRRENEQQCQEGDVLSRAAARFAADPRNRRMPISLLAVRSFTFVVPAFLVR
jgi:transposase